MRPAVIAATGLFTPPESISNDELVECFNTYVERFNAENEAAIAEGKIAALLPSSSAFIEKASGIKSRYVMQKSGILDPEVMRPVIPERSNEELSILAEIAVKAAEQALERWGKPRERIGARCAPASNMQRAYPAMAIEDAGGAPGCAGFGVRHERRLFVGDLRPRDRGGLHRDRHRRRCVLMVNPEICSGSPQFPRPRQPLHLRRRRDRGDRRARRPGARRAGDVLGTRLRTQFSNNIRNNAGFLNRAWPDRPRSAGQIVRADRAQVSVQGSGAAGVGHDRRSCRRDRALNCRRSSAMWLHQANINMNEIIGRRVLGRDPTPEENVIILDDYANTSSAGSIIAFHKRCDDMVAGDLGLICSFGAGYSAGTVFVRKR
ncbi:MAG: beta-ketoacyl-ACP synthase III [Rhodopseudomonas palustris]|nr:beta-ketoacyl-ACP synthase III [Rhodopseudomonas palustris]